jgi:hypothetical protein
MYIINMRHKILTSSLQSISISKTYITFAISLIIYFIWHSFVQQFINNNSCDNITKQDLEKSL